MFTLSLFVLVSLIPGATAQQKSPALAWRNSKELARLRQTDTPLEERKQLAHTIAERARQRDEEVELAREFLDLALAKDTPDGFDSDLMLEVRGSPSPGVRGYVLRELGQSRDYEKIRCLLHAATTWKDPRIDEFAAQKFLEQPTSDASSCYAWFLEADGYGSVLPRIVARLDDPSLKDESVLDTLLETGEGLTHGTGGYHDWKRACLRWMSDPRERLRHAAADYVSRKPEEEDLPSLSAAARHPDWCVRRAALDAFAKLRSPEAVDALLELMAREEPDSRLRAGCARTLARLALLGLGNDIEAWKRWWSDAGRKLPPPAAEGAPPVDDHLQAPALFGTRVLSNRVLVVLDLDDLALRARLEAAAARRLQFARAELESFVRGLPDTAQWNVIVSRDNPVAWKPGLAVAPGAGGRLAREAGAQKKEALASQRERELELLRAWLDEQLGLRVPEKVKPTKRAWETMRAAWSQPDADTILWISDGLRITPKLAEGKQDTNEGALATTARDVDAKRHVRVHTFSLGEDVPRLRKLAEQMWGEYRRVP